MPSLSNSPKVLTKSAILWYHVFNLDVKPRYNKTLYPLPPTIRLSARSSERSHQDENLNRKRSKKGSNKAKLGIV